MLGFKFKLDDFQEEAIKHIDDRKSVVVCAPTGAGKTCIAEYAIQKALEDGCKIFYTTPLKALSNQKYYDFMKKYGEDKVGLLTGDSSCNRDAQIVIMTTEVFRNMLYGTNFGSVNDNLKDVRYVVLDEVHYMNDEQRGTVWEESIIYCPSNVQIIALSATVANSKELTNWINSVHSQTELVYTDFRPVPLRFYYYDSSKPSEVLPIMTPSGQLNNRIRPESKQKFFKNKNKPQRSFVKDIIRVLKEKEMLPAIYFTFSRKKCDEQTEKCESLDLLTPNEKREIKEIVDEYLKENPYLAHNKHLKSLYCGVAAHHAGLLPGWKVLVELLFQKGLIKVVFATETLAAGINMPARTTIISSISKRTDKGHRTLTANEFLQMSGRAGRRGMDDIGYVVVVGTVFQSPEEVLELVKSKSNMLESKFAPNYSMVTNLLQRFSLEQSKELILKSFGYFSSGVRLQPLLNKEKEYANYVQIFENFECDFNLKNEAVLEFNKVKNLYVQHRHVFKTLKKQLSKNAKQEDKQMFYDFEKKCKDLLHKMHSFPCETCKLYKKHAKEIELLERYQKKYLKIQKDIEFEKDVYWKKFLNHKDVLNKMGYLEENYPTTKGVLISMIRAENELFLSEIILSGVLENLTHSDLASVVCAISTEDIRIESTSVKLPVSPEVRRVFKEIKNIRYNVHLAQKEHNIDTQMFINPYFSPLIAEWVNGCDWESLISQTTLAEGDIVRSFKRTVDVLRQLTLLPSVSDNLKLIAKETIMCIIKDPINID